MGGTSMQKHACRVPIDQDLPHWFFKDFLDAPNDQERRRILKKLKKELEIINPRDWANFEFDESLITEIQKLRLQPELNDKEW